MFRDYQGFAHETLSSAAVEVNPTVTTMANARAALITVEDQAVRVRYDGGAASTTAGHLIAAGGSIRVSGASSVKNLSLCAATGTAAIHITYER